MSPPSIPLFSRFSRALRRRVSAWRAVRTARRTVETRFGSGSVRRVLVVCYGNIYRSPLFAEILRRGGTGIDVRSAGFHPRDGRESPRDYVTLCAARGISLDAHRSAVTRPEDLEWADTIVCMDRHNWSALESLGADPAKILFAGALIEGDVEISDPYGRPAPEVERIVARIERAALGFNERVQGGAAR